MSRNHEDEGSVFDIFVDLSLGTVGLLFIFLASVLVWLFLTPNKLPAAQAAEVDKNMGDLDKQLATLRDNVDGLRTRLEEMGRREAEAEKELAEAVTGVGRVRMKKERLGVSVKAEAEKKAGLERQVEELSRLEKEAVAKKAELSKNGPGIAGKTEDHGGRPMMKITELGTGRYRIGGWEFGDPELKALLSSSHDLVLHHENEVSAHMRGLEESLGWGPTMLRMKW